MNSQGVVEYTRQYHGEMLRKFGHNADCDSGVEEDLWDGGGDANANGTYDYPSAVEELAISSDAADVEEIVVQGLDGDYAPISRTVLMAGTTKTVIPGGADWLRTFRAFDNDNTVFTGTIYIYKSDDTVVAGVPQTPAKIRAIINPAYQQTMMALYTVPVGHIGIITHAYAGITKRATAVAAEIQIKARLFGKSFRTRETWQVHSYSGTKDPDFGHTPFIFPEKTDIKLAATASTNDTDVHGGFRGFIIPGAWA